jgi:hypothetical protein
MIFSRYGEPVEIVAYCGKHKPSWCSCKLTLVKVRYPGDEERYAHPINLKADGGWDEIDKAVDAAPEELLPAKEIKAALEQAA